MPSDLGGCGQPYRISDNNVIVGSRTTAFVWTAATGFVDLGTLGGSWSIARDVNEIGWVVGSSATQDGGASGFLYTPSAGMRDLRSLTGLQSLDATAVNSRGQVLGRMPEGPFLWSETGGTSILPPLTRRYRRGAGFGLNDRGDVVGQDAISYLGDIWATAWLIGSSPMSLGTIGCAGITASLATSISNDRTIVGTSVDICGPFRSFIWRAETGIHELPIPPGDLSCGWPRVNRRGTLAAGTCSTAVVWRLR
ncbi:MAG: hypothetical protein IPK85_05550 [Gemmatimonadetes bacterium]|nr:hypothetical protein [Gemmatimonadota bacterium]